MTLSGALDFGVSHYKRQSWLRLVPGQSGMSRVYHRKYFFGYHSLLASDQNHILLWAGQLLVTDKTEHELKCIVKSEAST